MVVSNRLRHQVGLLDHAISRAQPVSCSIASMTTPRALGTHGEFHAFRGPRRLLSGSDRAGGARRLISLAKLSKRSWRPTWAAFATALHTASDVCTQRSPVVSRSRTGTIRENSSSSCAMSVDALERSPALPHTSNASQILVIRCAPTAAVRSLDASSRRASSGASEGEDRSSAGRLQSAWPHESRFSPTPAVSVRGQRHCRYVANC